MITNSNRESAQIYAFPAKVRTAAVVGHGEQAKPVADLAAKRLPKTTSGSGWYHDAAIEEARQPKR
jgi:hypothetical protein